MIVGFFEDPELDDWSKDTLAWWDEYVFTCYVNHI